MAPLKDGAQKVTSVARGLDFPLIPSLPASLGKNTKPFLPLFPG